MTSSPTSSVSGAEQRPDATVQRFPLVWTSLRNCSTRVVLPMPASPEIHTKAPFPAAADSNAFLSSANSFCRPTLCRSESDSRAAGMPPSSLAAQSARARLSSFKVPTLWLVVPSPEPVPMSATGKVDKPALQQLLRSRGVRS